MQWFNKPKYQILNSQQAKEDIPDGLWVKCKACTNMYFKEEWDKNLKVCPSCGYHDRLNSRERIDLLLDSGSFKEENKGLATVDPLKFAGYQERIAKSEKKTALKEAVVTGTGKIEKQEIAFSVLDFSFMGGSMSNVVGEKITRNIETAIAKKLPLVICSASGGARMQEGIFSLMQMAKTSAALHKLADVKLPYISLLTDPTTGGVSASFAMLGDVIVSEPNALIGFAGPRVIEQTIKQKLPKGFQRAEFLLEHGFVDVILDRHSLKNGLSKLLKVLC